MRRRNLSGHAPSRTDILIVLIQRLIPTERVRHQCAGDALQKLLDVALVPGLSVLIQNHRLPVRQLRCTVLLELGTGFAFLGNQYHLNVGGDDFYIDLLFYNLNPRCYVVIELKTGEFKPEYAGQLNFYLSAVDGLVKQPQDNPTIGLAAM